MSWVPFNCFAEVVEESFFFGSGSESCEFCDNLFGFWGFSMPVGLIILAGCFHEVYAFAHNCMAENYYWFACDGVGFCEGGPHFLVVVAVYFEYFPVAGFEHFANVDVLNFFKAGG